MGADTVNRAFRCTIFPIYTHHVLSPDPSWAEKFMLEIDKGYGLSRVLSKSKKCGEKTARDIEGFNNNLDTVPTQDLSLHF